MVNPVNYKFVILATGFSILFFSGGSRAVLGLMLKPMTEDLGWSRSSLSLSFTAFMVVSALILPLVGLLVDRYQTHLRWMMATGILLVALGVGATGLASAQWHVLVTYGIFYAIGHSTVGNPIVGVMISRWFDQRRALANSLAVSGSAVGQLVIIAALAWAMTSITWREAYIVLGIATLAIVPLVLLLVRTRPEIDIKGSAKTRDVVEPDYRLDVTTPLRAIVVSRAFLLLVLVYVACGIQDFFMMTHVVAFAVDQSMNPVLAGNMLAAMGVAGMAGVLVSGLMADAYGAGRPTALCFLLRVILFGLILYVQSTVAIFFVALMYGLTFLVTAPLTVIFAGNIFGQARLGVIAGLLSASHMVAGGLGAAAGGIIFDRTGSYDGAFLIMLVLAGVALAITLMIREKC